MDVVVYDDGRIKVLDADELADAIEQSLIPKEYGVLALRNMNSLLELIYNNRFIEIQRLMNNYE